MRKLLVLLYLLGLTTLLACREDTQSMEQRNPVATIEVAGYDPMVVELYYDVAPNSVKNFIALANKGYYDGLIFHRVIKDFMIQGGGSTVSTCAIKGEFSANGHTNNISHVRGVISMARTSVKDSATSQFFIVHKDSAHLNGQYAAFGKLTSGFETLDAIAAVRTNFQDRPSTDIVITTITIDTFGVNYGKAECVK
jgi:peptidyl-prolyl cis-trans isomerase B (cyclophilin B)